MHEYMALHAHSNPLPSHSCSRDANKGIGGCSKKSYDKAKTGDSLGAAPNFSVRGVISNFRKMLRPWRGQEIYPFFP